MVLNGLVMDSAFNQQVAVRAGRVGNWRGTRR
jgi:hypothetical protein